MRSDHGGVRTSAARNFTPAQPRIRAHDRRHGRCGEYGNHRSGCPDQVESRPYGTVALHPSSCWPRLPGQATPTESTVLFPGGTWRPCSAPCGGTRGGGTVRTRDGVGRRCASGTWFLRRRAGGARHRSSGLSPRPAPGCWPSGARRTASWAAPRGPRSPHVSRRRGCRHSVRPAPAAIGSPLAPGPGAGTSAACSSRSPNESSSSPGAGRRPKGPSCPGRAPSVGAPLTRWLA